MRRLLAIFLLALLPFQFSWSAAAVYCGHETGEAAQHFGHHEHQHAGPAHGDADGAPADQTSPAGFDFDCSHCHGSFANMPAPLDSLSPQTLVAHPAMPVAGSMRTLAQSPPERPQWAPLA